MTRRADIDIKDELARSFFGRGAIKAAIDSDCVIVHLPWPDNRLNPNRRTHRAKLAELKAVARERAFYAVREKFSEPPDLGDGSIEFRLYFCPPDRRKRDLDNLHAACKAYQDGICDALQIDDARLHPQMQDWGAVTPGGEIIAVLDSGASAND